MYDSSHILLLNMDISRRTFITGLTGTILYPAASHAVQGTADTSVFGGNVVDGFGGANWVNEVLDSKPAPPPPKPANKAGHDQQYLIGEVPLRWLGTSEGYMFRFREGLEYNLPMFQNLNWFLRCRADKNTAVLMDYRLVEHLNYVSHWFGQKVISVHSGYRTPAYNRKLRERNHKAAPNSFHMAGRAVDFSVEGISIRDACSVALAFRNMQGFGGIGYYPGDGFVHIDTGPARQWVS
jgi:uncharacterized protein YcbK (DUF882 family)